MYESGFTKEMVACTKFKNAYLHPVPLTTFFFIHSQIEILHLFYSLPSRSTISIYLDSLSWNSFSMDYTTSCIKHIRNRLKHPHDIAVWMYRYSFYIWILNPQYFSQVCPVVTFQLTFAPISPLLKEILITSQISTPLYSKHWSVMTSIYFAIIKQRGKTWHVMAVLLGLVISAEVSASVISGAQLFTQTWYFAAFKHRWYGGVFLFLLFFLHIKFTPSQLPKLWLKCQLFSSVV